MKRTIWTSVLVGALGAAVAQAEVVPVGSDIFPPGPTDLEGAPSVAALSDGRFAVAWSAGGNFEISDVYAAVFAADGTLTVGPFQANDFTDGGQFEPDIGIDDDGRIVVTWLSYGAEGPCSACVRRFAADGTPLGVEVQVDPDGEPFVSQLRVDSAPAGEFVVAWGDGESCEYPFGPCFSAATRAQRFAADGSTLGARLDVDTGGFINDMKDVDVLPDGGFVVLWAGRQSAFAQRYGPDDAPVGNRGSTPILLQAKVSASPDGSYVVSSGGNDSGAPYVQTFTSNGVKVGSFAGVSSCPDPFPNAFQTDVGRSDDGTFLYAWASGTDGGFPECSDGDENAIWVRAFAGDGTPIGAEFVLNSYTTGVQAQPSVAAVGDGRYVVAWRSAGGTGAPDTETRLALRLLETPCNDADADGYGNPSSAACASPGTDCDDSDPNVNPGMAEIPGNGLDDDCNPSTPGACQPQQ